MALTYSWRTRSCILGVVVAVLWATLAIAQTPDEGKGCDCVGRVGNVDCDYTDAVTLADLDRLIDHMYISLRPLANPQEANCDADPLCLITMGDLTALLDHLFITLSPLPWCPQLSNHPPETVIDSLPQAPLIDGLSTDNPSLGVRLRWSGTDREDNPYDPQVDAFRWKLFGPYDDTTYERIVSEFAVPVLRTPTGMIYRRGQAEPAHFFICDTSYVHGQQVITCDTVLVDTLSDSNRFGLIDTLLDVECAEFLSNPDLLRIVDSSSEASSPWSPIMRDTFFNIYADHPSDTTTLRHFIFWVTARDLDEPLIEDPTPAWCDFGVFEPRHERAVLVVNWQSAATTNGPSRPTVKNYWNQAVQTWLAGRPDISGTFDSARDYRTIAQFEMNGSSEMLLRMCLQHKVLIHSADDVTSVYWQPDDLAWRPAAMAAAMAGTPTWVAMRVPVGDHSVVSPGDTVVASTQYQFEWGVTRVRFSGWRQMALRQGIRIEDFVGAQPTDSATWPVLAVDSALLHQRYTWYGSCPWVPSLAALPEVDYCVPTPDAEVLYTYESLYSGQHPQGPDFSFDGRPVMVRVDRGDFFRTVHSLFTPIGLAEPGAQTLVNRVLDWLYDCPAVGSTGRQGR